MTEEKPAFSPAFRIASVAILAALTTVLTKVVQVPLPARGYINLGNVAIVFSAIVLGLFSAALAGVFFEGAGPALTEAPRNLVQGGAGVVLGLLVAAAVCRSYPPVRQWKW